jgi:heme O synthase-like polyprenyltransferase
MLVTRRLRRRRKGRTRRRKISKGEINQPLIIMLGVLMILTSLPTHITSQNSLAGFVRVTTFLRISLVFPRF